MNRVPMQWEKTLDFSATVPCVLPRPRQSIACRYPLFPLFALLLRPTATGAYLSELRRISGPKGDLIVFSRYGSGQHQVEQSPELGDYRLDSKLDLHLRSGAESASDQVRGNGGSGTKD